MKSLIVDYKYDKKNSNGQMYPTVTISEDNTIKYVTDKEVLDLLTNGTGVIYFGFKTCPWCRTLVDSLVKVANQKNEVINYFDITEINSRFEVKDNEIKVLRKGTDNYYKILDKLSDYLNDYYLTDSEGNYYETSEKRIYSPTLVAIADGQITSFHVGTLDSQESGYDKLSSEQRKELESIISNLIESKNKNDACYQNIC